MQNMIYEEHNKGTQTRYIKILNLNTMVNYLSLWLQVFACDHNLFRLQNRFNQPKGCQKKQAVVELALVQIPFFF